MGFGWLLMLLLFVLGIFDSFALLDYAGEIKRGFKIRSEPLSPARHAFLEGLESDVVEEAWLPWAGLTITGFIKVQDRQVLIQRRRADWRTSWPYVGYVDLRAETPAIEYRSSLPMHLLLLPFVLTIVAIPFIGLSMVSNYRRERDAILGFIDEQMTLVASKGDVP
jgi:hypothetical protein